MLLVNADDRIHVARFGQHRQQQRRQEYIGRDQHQRPETAEQREALHRGNRGDGDQEQTRRIGDDAERTGRHHHPERNLRGFPFVTNDVVDLVEALRDLHAVTERARDEQQRDHHDQRLDRLTEPAHEAKPHMAAVTLVTSGATTPATLRMYKTSASSKAVAVTPNILSIWYS